MISFDSNELFQIIKYSNKLNQFPLISKKVKQCYENIQEDTLFFKEVLIDQELTVPSNTTIIKIKLGSGWYVKTFTTLAIALKDLKLQKLIINLHSSALILFDKLLQFIPNNTKVILEVQGLDETIVEKYSNDSKIKIGGFNSQINEAIIQKKAYILPEKITTPSGISRSYLSFEASVFNFYSPQIWKLYLPMNLKLKATGETDIIIKMKQFILNSIILTGKLKTIDLNARNICVIRSFVPVDNCEELEVEQPLGFPEYIGNNKLKKLNIQYSKNLTKIDLNSSKTIETINIICCGQLNELNGSTTESIQIIDSPLKVIHFETINYLKLSGVGEVSIEGNVNDLQSDSKCIVNGTPSHSTVSLKTIDKTPIMIRFIPIYIAVLAIIIGGIICFIKMN